MHPNEFHKQIDQKRLVATLEEAEAATHGKIYVYVSHREVEDALAQAWKRFAKLGLSAVHEHRATVLIYLAPRTQKFAIVGDEAIHDRCGDELWGRLAEGLGNRLKAGDVTEALVVTIGELRGVMGVEFPKG